MAAIVWEMGKAHTIEQHRNNGEDIDLDCSVEQGFNLLKWGKINKRNPIIIL